MSAVNSTTFTNRKPPLTGSDTHAASLSGSVTSDLTTLITNFVDPGGACSIGNAGVWLTFASRSLTPVSAVNEISLFAQARFNTTSTNTMRFQLIRDGDTGSPLAESTSGSTSGVISVSHTILNETAAAHTYTWRAKDDADEGHCEINSKSYAILSEAVDTHVANLTGSNTQDTKNANIIRG